MTSRQTQLTESLGALAQPRDLSPEVALGVLVLDGPVRVLPPAPHLPRARPALDVCLSVSSALPGPARLPMWQQPQPLSLLD